MALDLGARRFRLVICDESHSIKDSKVNAGPTNRVIEVREALHIRTCRPTSCVQTCACHRNVHTCADPRITLHRAGPIFNLWYGRCAWQAQRTKQTVPLLEAARRAVLLTGTPALSRPKELFTQAGPDGHLT